MKKLYSFLALTTLLASGLSAQTTITATALPQVGYVYNMASDTTPADLPTFTVTAGSSSAQNWNYSSQFANVYGESTSFVAPSSGQGYTNFSSSNLASDQGGGNWGYFITNGSGLFIDGAYGNIQGTYVAIDFSPNEVVIPVPCTYNTSNNGISVASFTTTYNSQTVLVKHTADRRLIADAFGSLTTPTATYPNTIRLKTWEGTSDSIFFNILGSWNFVTRQTDTTTTYTWLQNTQDAQLMQISEDKTGAVTKAQYLMSFSNGVATINQQQAAFNLFPNPASNMTYLTYHNNQSGNVSLEMFDMNGRLIGNLLDENQSIGNHSVMINVESMHLPKGLYFLRLLNGDGLQTIKLSVN